MIEKKFILEGVSDYNYKSNDMEVWAQECSDEYHSFNELYNHRHALFCALTKIYDNYVTPLQTRVKCWKSKLHSDGSSFDGWFIVGMTIIEFEGNATQISYHIPIKWWPKFYLMELDKAPEWDGHTPNDVIDRLMGL